MYKAGTWHSHSIKCAARHLGFLIAWTGPGPKLYHLCMAAATCGPELLSMPTQASQSCDISRWSGLSTSTFRSHDFIRQDLSGPWRGFHYLCFSLNEPSCQGLVWGVLNIWGEQLLIILEQHVMQNEIKFCFTHMMFLEILTGLASKREVQWHPALLSVYMKFGNCCDIQVSSYLCSIWDNCF
jgi:hypothetical protein